MISFSNKCATYYVTAPVNRRRVCRASSNSSSGSAGSSDTANKFELHRQRARDFIKEKSEKRVELEKASLDKLAIWQTRIKQVVKEDMQLIKQIVTGKMTDDLS